MKKNLSSTIILFCSVCLIIMTTSHAGAKERLTVAYVPGKKSSFFQSVEKGIRKKAKEYNANVIVPGYPDNWDAIEQIKIIQAIFAKGSPHFLIICPTTGRQLQKILLELHNEGIEIITIDHRLIIDPTIEQRNRRFPLVHIATDQWAGGKAMANHMAKLIDAKGSIYINSTFPDIPKISQRFKAFLQALESIPNISIVGIDVAGIDYSNSDKGIVGSSKELERNAHNQSLVMMQKHPDIKAIYCTNDLSGKGIIKTMLVTGLEGSVKIGVWDATREMVGAIDNGIIDFALAQKPEEIGIAAVFWGNRYLQTGESVPANVTIDFKLITKSNSANEDIRKLIYE